jgi:uncharacterized damage-inducible protein DinB
MSTSDAPEAPGDECGALLAQLAEQRGGVRRAAGGLTEEQAWSAPSAGELSVAGLLKHLAHCERGWLRTMTGDPVDPSDPAERARWSSSFVRVGDESLASVLALYAEVAAEVERAARAVPSMDATFTVPPAPWDPGGTRSWRWGLLHLIGEVARHAGHADIVRETIDGRKADELHEEPGPA